MFSGNCSAERTAWFLLKRKSLPGLQVILTKSFADLAACNCSAQGVHLLGLGLLDGDFLML